MNQVYRIWIGSYICAIFMLAFSTTSRADEESSWTVGGEEPSPGELFAMFEAAREQKEGLTFAFPPKFRFEADALRDRGGQERVNRMFGVDISRYQGGNFPISSLGEHEIRFVYAKATQGVHIKDETFDHNWKELDRLGHVTGGKRLYRGAYHFLAADDDGAAQAERFVAYVKLHGGFADDDLLPAVDVEWDRACRTCDDRWSNYNPDEIIAKVHAFRARVRELVGRTPLIYSNKSFLGGVGVSSPDQLARFLEGSDAWIFDLNPKDTKFELPSPNKNLPQRLWQFSWSAYVPNHAGDVDVDVFLGDEETFKKAFLGDK